MPPTPRRSRHNAVFDDYSQYAESTSASDRITASTLRERAAVHDAEASGTCVQHLRSWPNHEAVLHEFPTCIKSICAAPLLPKLGERHSQTWIAVRTISSTVFASLKIPRRSVNTLEAHRLRLSGILEIMHGDSVLPSAIKGTRIGDTNERDDVTTARSHRPIVDVCFHPHLGHRALTIDARGAIGLFECDLEKVQAQHWSGSVHWHQVQGSAHHNIDSPWSVRWASYHEQTCITACADGVWTTRISNGERSEVYSPDDADILSVELCQLPKPSLWVATTRALSIFNVSDANVIRPLLSVSHARNKTARLRVSVTVHSASNTLSGVLTSLDDRLVAVYRVLISPQMDVASLRNEPTARRICLPRHSSPSSSPTLAHHAGLDSGLWNDWFAQVINDGVAGSHERMLMLQGARDGSLWLQGVTMYSSPTLAPVSEILATSNRHSSKSAPISSSQNCALSQSLHQFTSLYNVLFSRADQGDVRDGISDVDGRRLDDKVSSWIKANTPSDVILTHHDLLNIATGNSSDNFWVAPPAMANADARIELLSRLDNLCRFVRNNVAIEHHVSVLPRPFDTADIESGVKKTTDLYTAPFLQPALTSSSERLARLQDNLRAAIHEGLADMMLVSKTVSLRSAENASPGFEEARTDDPREQRADDNHAKNVGTKSLRYTHSFFMPHVSADDVDVDGDRGPTVATSSSGRQRRPRMTRAARVLLSEWELGADPSRFVFRTSAHGHREGSEDESGGHLAATLQHNAASIQDGRVNSGSQARQGLDTAHSFSLRAPSAQHSLPAHALSDATSQHDTRSHSPAVPSLQGAASRNALPTRPLHSQPLPHQHHLHRPSQSPTQVQSKSQSQAHTPAAGAAAGAAAASQRPRKKRRQGGF